MIVYGSFKISKTLVGVAKIAIRGSLIPSVTQFSRNFQDTFMVVYDCFETSQTVIGIAKITIRLIVFQFFSCVCRLPASFLGNKLRTIYV